MLMGVQEVESQSSLPVLVSLPLFRLKEMGDEMNKALVPWSRHRLELDMASVGNPGTL